MGKSSPSSDLRETAGLVDGMIRQSRLVWRLWRDARVPGWTKLIPLAGLVYLLSPIDLIPDLMLPGLGQLDGGGEMFQRPHLLDQSPAPLLDSPL